MIDEYIKEYRKAYVDFMREKKRKYEKEQEKNLNNKKSNEGGGHKRIRNNSEYKYNYNTLKKEFNTYLINKSYDDNTELELILKFRKDLHQWEKRISSYGLIKGVIPEINTIALRTDATTAKKLIDRDSSKIIKSSLESTLESIEASNIVNVIPSSNSKKTYRENILEELWNLDLIGLDEAFNYSHGENVKIAIIDTGVDYSHPDLKERFGFDKGYDFLSEDKKPMDENGHGTHVAGITSGSETGIARKARLYALRVLDADGSGTEFDVMRAINYAFKHEYSVVNMSLGSSFASDAFENLCDYVYERGLTLVAAAGNESYGPSYPASFGDSVISVAAIDSELNHASFSNIFETTDISAPGVEIYSTYLNGEYATFSGTSMATPHVTGTIALYLSLDRNATPRIINQILSDHAQPLEDDSLGYDNHWIFGSGLIRADLIMKSAKYSRIRSRILGSKHKSKFKLIRR